MLVQETLLKLMVEVKCKVVPLRIQALVQSSLCELFLQAWYMCYPKPDQLTDVVGETGLFRLADLENFHYFRCVQNFHSFRSALYTILSSRLRRKDNKQLQCEKHYHVCHQYPPSEIERQKHMELLWYNFTH